MGLLAASAPALLGKKLHLWLIACFCYVAFESMAQNRILEGFIRVPAVLFSGLFLRWMKIRKLLLCTAV